MPKYCGHSSSVNMCCVPLDDHITPQLLIPYGNFSHFAKAFVQPLIHTIPSSKWFTDFPCRSFSQFD